MSTATVFDFTPSQFRRTTQRQTPEPSTETTFSIFSDMADGVTVLQHFFNFARKGETTFEHKETKLVLLIAGLCGDGGRPIEVFDEQLAEHARCSDRTVRQWRKDYLAKAQKLNFLPLDIKLGDYDPTKKRYAKTAYTIRPDIAEAIDRTVAEARSMPEYEHDRLKALERAAEGHYDEIPNAPPRGRKRTPKKSLRSPVVQNINNAAKNLDKGKAALAEMPAQMREALLAGQGEDLHATLLEMRDKIDGLLSSISESTDYKEVSYMPEISSGIPPPSSEGEPEPEAESAKGKSHFRVKEEETRKHSPEDIKAWEDITARLTVSPIQSVNIELMPLEPSATPSDEAPAFDEELSEEPVLEMADPEAANEQDWELNPVEQAEREAIQAEASNLSLEVDYHADEAEPVAAFEIGAMVYPCTSDGVLLHAEPSSVAERRLIAGKWQYRLDGFMQWRGEHLYTLHVQFIE